MCYDALYVVVWLKIRKDDIKASVKSISRAVVVWLKIRKDDILIKYFPDADIVVVWLKIRKDDIKWKKQNQY